MNKKLFSAMSRRRVSCPQITQQLWDAIKIIKYQRQVPNLERIARYMSRVHGVNDDEVGRQLNHCVRDGLIRLIKKIGSKGSQAGVEQEGYGLPPGTVEKDDHDWYCSECHSGGDVICCTTCYRVYHLACITTEELPDEDVKNTFICIMCKMCDTKKKEIKLKKRTLNHLLRFACSRMKDRLPVTLMDRQVPSTATYMSDRSASGQCLSQHRSSSDCSGWVTDQDDAWRSQFLIYRPMDLKVIEEKTNTNKYKLVEEFQADAQTIVHNVVIYHGVHSSLADMARQMLRDCIYDLQEMVQCADCYRYSNEKKGKHWFCQLCKNPHQLVYAKQKTFPFWPAKVIKVTDDQYDVRFFGGQHQRAVVHKTNIRPISVNIHTLKVKRTSAWNKACEELKHHQKFIEEANKNPKASKAGESSADEEAHTSAVTEVKEPQQPDVPLKKKRGRKRKIPLVEEPVKKLKVKKEESMSVDETSTGSSNNIQPAMEAKKEGSSPEDNMVSSSCQEPRCRSIAVQTIASPQHVPKTAANKAAMEKIIQDAEVDKQQAVATAVRELQDHLTTEHSLEIKQLKEKHRAELAEIKKKPWCFNCGTEAIYHCCWNTAYCSIECQQTHWHRDHKRVCRRKH